MIKMLQTLNSESKSFHSKKWSLYTVSDYQYRIVRCRLPSCVSCLVIICKSVRNAPWWKPNGNSTEWVIHEITFDISLSFHFKAFRNSYILLWFFLITWRTVATTRRGISLAPPSLPVDLFVKIHHFSASGGTLANGKHCINPDHTILCTPIFRVCLSSQSVLR